jgi:predicted N-acyltransferase
MSEFRARLLPSAAGIGRVAWNACANPGNDLCPHPFTQYDFFAALEESGSAVEATGWQPCHLVLEQGGAIRGLMPLYLKHHSQGEYVFDHAWADALERAGGDYYPKLQCAVPFTPVTGRRLLGTDAALPALLEAGKTIVKQLDASSLHITFLEEAEWRTAGEAGYLLRTDRQFHWKNDGYRDFEDFLSRLSSAKRKNLRKERAKVREAGVTFEHLTGAAITEAHWDQFFEFYTDTGSRKWGNPYLTRDFFSRLSATMASQILLVMARHEGRYVAGALNLFGGGTLFGRNWGATGYLPFLHFETCYYQAIDFAIANGLKKVEAGAQGEHKLLRGYVPEETYSAHYIAHPGLARAVDAYLTQERDAIAENIQELTMVSPFKKGD